MKTPQSEMIEGFFGVYGIVIDTSRLYRYCSLWSVA